jgi:hypothetical protein
MIALALCVAGSTAQAAAGVVSFGGNSLQQLRHGTGTDRFAEYGRRADQLSETLTVRLLADRAPFKAQVATLVASIRKANPKVKLKVLQRNNSDDVMISYLGDLGGTRVSQVLWRLAALGDRSVTAIYQMDFDIYDEDAKDRVTAHAAERALVTFAPADIARLVADEN